MTVVSWQLLITYQFDSLCGCILAINLYHPRQIQQTTNWCYYLYFSQKIGFGISCRLSPIYMKCQILFSGKNKSISKCHLLKFLPKVLSFMKALQGTGKSYTKSPDKALFFFFNWKILELEFVHLKAPHCRVHKFTLSWSTLNQTLITMYIMRQIYSSILIDWQNVF